MKSKFYKQFGLCYNNGDFSSIYKKLHRDCIYKSYDFLYVLKGRDKVVGELNDLSKKNLSQEDKDKIDIYTGYYTKPFLWFTSLNDCLIFAHRKTRESTRIVCFKTKFGKITAITGLDPNDFRHTKAKLI